MPEALLIHDADLGVRCLRQRGRRAGRALIHGFLWGVTVDDEMSQDRSLLGRSPSSTRYPDWHMLLYYQNSSLTV